MDLVQFQCKCNYVNEYKETKCAKMTKNAAKCFTRLYRFI